MTSCQSCSQLSLTTLLGKRLDVCVACFLLFTALLVPFVVNFQWRWLSVTGGVTKYKATLTEDPPRAEHELLHQVVADSGNTALQQQTVVCTASGGTS